MAKAEGYKQARKPKRSSQINEIYTRPLKNGTGLEPRWSQEHYRGIPLHPHVKARMDEYAAIPSLTMQEIARMMK